MLCRGKPVTSQQAKLCKNQKPPSLEEVKKKKERTARLKSVERELRNRIKKK